MRTRLELAETLKLEIRIWIIKGCFLPGLTGPIMTLLPAQLYLEDKLKLCNNS